MCSADSAEWCWCPWRVSCSGCGETLIDRKYLPGGIILSHYLSRRSVAVCLACVFLIALLMTPTSLAQLGDGFSWTQAWENFEDLSLDPLVHFVGQPMPSIIQTSTLVGFHSAFVPCLKKDGDEPIILLSPTSSEEAEFAWLADLSDPCAAEGTSFRLMVLTAGGVEVAHVYLRPMAGELEVSTSVMTDGGAARVSPWLIVDRVAVASGKLGFDLRWTAARHPGADDGSLELCILRADGSTVAVSYLSGVDNDSHLVDQAKLGAMGLSEVDDEAGGLLFDELIVR